jgi:mannose-6-phosphate isomerase-like protein (cupin superfamily)
VLTARAFLFHALRFGSAARIASSKTAKRGSMDKFTITDAISRHMSANSDYTRLFERNTFDIGFYRPIRFDKQTPHTRDELYVIAAGSGEFFCGRETQSFATGDVFFVPAGIAHGFTKFTYDFAAWVILFGIGPDR